MFQIPTAIMIVVLLGLASVAIKGDQVGSEFRVNTTTSNDQVTPSVALNTTGNFVVVWSSLLQDGSGYGIYAQMFDSSGVKKGAEWRENFDTIGNQDSPDVAMSSDGNFTMVWHDDHDWQPSSSTYNGKIVYQDQDSEGHPIPQLPPWDGDDPDEYDPAVATAGDGTSIVIVWTSATGDGSGEGVRVQQHGPQSWVEDPYWANTNTTGDQGTPDVAMDHDGDAIVVWRSEGQDGDLGGIFGQMISANGSIVGSEFVVNSQTIGDQSQPAVAMDSDGDFVVVWTSNGSDGSGRGICAQLYSSSGMMIGSQFQVNSNSTGNQSLPSVSMSFAGDFVITWSSEGQDGGGYAIAAQRYLADGSPLGDEFIVNAYLTSDQTRPSVSVNSVGDFIAVWESHGQDGSGSGIYGQLYNRAPIPELPFLLLPVLGVVAIVLVTARARHPRVLDIPATGCSFRFDND